MKKYKKFQEELYDEYLYQEDKDIEKMKKHLEKKFMQKQKKKNHDECFFIDEDKGD